MVKGPCVLCGDTDYMPSMGGPGICPSCDCGKFNRPEELKRLREENAELKAELRCQVGIWRSELEDAKLKISAWKAKADRRADKISELEAEVERLRGGVPDFRAQSRIAIAGQRANSAEVSRAINNMDQLTSIRIEENEDHD